MLASRFWAAVILRIIRSLPPATGRRRGEKNQIPHPAPSSFIDSKKNSPPIFRCLGEHLRNLVRHVSRLTFLCAPAGVPQEEDEGSVRRLADARRPRPGAAHAGSVTPPVHLCLGGWSERAREGGGEGVTVPHRGPDKRCAGRSRRCCCSTSRRITSTWSRACGSRSTSPSTPPSSSSSPTPRCPSSHMPGGAAS